MGGNLVLKLAGEWGKRAPLCGVAAVCPAIDLAPGADALHEPANRLYEWNFLRGLRLRLERKARLFPGIYQIRASVRFAPSVNSTTRSWRATGIPRCRRLLLSCCRARVVDSIAVPTLILHDLDDPFIRLLRRPAPNCLPIPHRICGDSARRPLRLSFPRPGNEIHWAEATVIRFLLAATAEANGS